MKLINSLISPGILKNNLKRFYLIAVAYFIFLFVTLPVYFYANNGDWASIEPINGYNLFKKVLEFSDMGIFVLFITCALAFIVSLIVNRYLNTQNSTIFNHSLPVGKAKLYITNFVTAKFIIMVPLAIIALILIVEKWLMGWVAFRILDVIKWLIISCICVAFIYALTTFISMLTGSTIFAGILSAALLSLEYPIAYLIVATEYIFVRGVYLEKVALKPFEKITALIRFATLNSNPMSMFEGIMYIIVSVALFFAGLYVYKIRKNEKATETITFDILKPIFKYIVTILACLSVGIVFIAITNFSLLGAFAGYILGITLGYYISEMVIQKSIFVFKEYKGYVISLVIFLIIALGIKFDVTGYESRVPDLEDIESANFTSNIYYMSNYDFSSSEWTGERVPYTGNNVTDLATIEKIRELHKDLTVTSYTTFDHNKAEARGRNYFIVYKLKNGKVFIRNFNYNEADNYDSLKAVYEDDAFQYAQHKDVFEYNHEEFNRLGIVNTYLNTRIDILDIDKADELLVEVEKDVKNKTYAPGFGSAQLSIRLYKLDLGDYNHLKENNTRLTEKEIRNKVEEEVDEIIINSECVNTINWLKENGYYDSLVVNSSNVEEMVIFKNGDFKLPEEGAISYYYQNQKIIYEAFTIETNSLDELLEEVKESGKAISVVNDYQIANIMLDSVYDDEAYYCILYKLSNANIDAEYYEHISYDDNYKQEYETGILFLNEKDLPAELAVVLNR